MDEPHGRLLLAATALGGRDDDVLELAIWGEAKILVRTPKLLRVDIEGSLMNLSQWKPCWREVDLRASSATPRPVTGIGRRVSV